MLLKTFLLVTEVPVTSVIFLFRCRITAASKNYLSNTHQEICNGNFPTAYQVSLS